jgi:hypothetical protein
MNQFTHPLEITPAKSGLFYLTSRAFEYHIGMAESGIKITVPRGFKTNLASVPRPLWWLLPPHHPRYAAAAVLHDYLCAWAGFNHVIADAVFYEAMRVLGVGRFRETIMWAGARLWHVIK